MLKFGAVDQVWPLDFFATGIGRGRRERLAAERTQRPAMGPDDSDWDHWHYGHGAPWIEPSCPYAGRAYEPGACGGDDLCAACEPHCDSGC